MCFDHWGISPKVLLCSQRFDQHSEITLTVFLLFQRFDILLGSSRSRGSDPADVQHRIRHILGSACFRACHHVGVQVSIMLNLKYLCKFITQFHISFNPLFVDKPNACKLKWSKLESTSID